MINDHDYESLPLGDFDDDEEVSINGAIKQKIKYQDNTLEALGKSVLRLGEMSLHISSEIDLQNTALSDLEDDIDNSEHNSKKINDQIRALNQTAAREKQWFIIAILVLIILFLVYLILKY